MLPRTHEAVKPRLSLCKQTSVCPETVDGQPIPLVGILEMDMKINQETVRVVFYITEDPNIAPILGLDVMRQMQKIEIDFNSGDKVTFGKMLQKSTPNSYIHPQVNSLQMKPVIGRIAVKVGDDVTIPARCEMVVIGKLEVGDPDALTDLQGASLLVEPSVGNGERGCQSMVWGRSVGVLREGKIPVRVCNMSEETTTIHKGTTIGDAETLPEHPIIACVSDDVMTADSVTTDTEEKVLKDLLDSAQVTDEEKPVLQKFLLKHREVFSMKGELGRFDDSLFTINTGDANPTRCMPRPVPHHRKIEVDRQLDEMLARGLIKPSQSDWASPILMVKKKDGTLRFCIDYRRLNDVTKHDSYPLPNIQDSLLSLGGQLDSISVVDLACGYWQMGMDPDSQEKAAFTTHRGLFQPVVLPFGPKGGVAHFSRVMNSLLGFMQWKQLLIYLDDILVFGRDFKEHLQRLDMVFSTLRRANLKLKPSKCKLFQKSVQFLGHQISAEGVTPLQDKIEVVKSWPPPKGKDELQSFLGLVSYYRRYVEKFATIAEPLNQLTRKNVPFKWSTDCEEAFQRLKRALINHPVLAYPDFNQQFILTTDASSVGLGGVLSQIQQGTERVISYASRALTKAERNYSATERECLAIVWATEHNDYFLLGAPFIIYTDHNPLTYLRSIARPQGRLARWILKLEQYEYQMRYRPGKSIPHADNLSRHPSYVAAIQLPTEWTDEELRIAQEEDSVLRKVIDYYRLKKLPPTTEDAPVKHYCQKMDKLSVTDGILTIRYDRGAQSFKQVIVPANLVPRLLEKAHDESGHYSAGKTLDTIRQKYYWDTLFKDTTSWCRTCSKCQERKHPGTKARAPLQYPPIASEPSQLVAMDFVGPLPEADTGNKHMLVITDAFSKFAEVFPLPDQTAAVTADALWWKYFSRHGVPAILHADQGRNFESAVIQHLCERLGVKKTRTTGYHPSGNGGVERYNKTLVERISLLLEQEDQKDWEKWIPQVLFDYHSTTHSSTGFTPFQLHYGRQPRSPFATLTLPQEKVKDKSVKQYMSSYKRNIRTQQAIAGENLKKSMEDRKRYYDQHLHHHTYSKGDLVMCRNYHCKRGCKPKLMRERWTGPWEVVQVRGPVNFRITRQVGKKKKRMLVHHDRLKPYHTRPERLHKQDENGEVDNGVMDDASAVSNKSNRVASENECRQSGKTVQYFSDSDSDSDSEEPVPVVPVTPDRRIVIPGAEGGEPVGEGAEIQRLGSPGRAAPYVSRSGRECKKTRRLVEDLHFGQ